MEDVVAYIFDEDLNLNRIGESRSHMDDGYSLNDDGNEGGCLVQGVQVDGTNIPTLVGFQ